MAFSPASDSNMILLYCNCTSKAMAIAGVEMNGYGLLRLVLLFLEWFVGHAMWTLLIPSVYLAKLMRLVTSPHASVALVGAHVLLGSSNMERIMRKRKDADAYYMDSGASVSIVNDKDVLEDCKPANINVNRPDKWKDGMGFDTCSCVLRVT